MTETRPPPLLTVEDIKLSYGAIEALHGVSLQVGTGEIVALIGANGAGKTSTLRAISGMVSASAGRIVFAGRVTAAATTSMRADQLVPLGMAHAPEGRGIFLNLSVQENLQLGAYLRRDHADIATDVEEYLTLFPILRTRYRQVAGTLSGGEQQMLAVARALMSRPKLLLLDEPSLGLAPQIIEKIFAILRTIHARGVSILLVEQNAHLALSLAHHAYVLETGMIVTQGRGRDLLASPEIRKAYLGE
jgi:branched-chain amino acid transport system ATP-binding protein